MSSSNSLSFNLSRRFSFLRKIYIYYNIYIRNFKFFNKSSQFDEDKKIIKLFVGFYERYFGEKLLAEKLVKTWNFVFIKA